MIMHVRSITSTFGALLLGAATMLAFAAPVSAQPPSPPKPPGERAPLGVTSIGIDDVGTLHCAHDHHDGDPRFGRLFDENFVRIRSGPHLACTALGQGQRNHRVNYHCYAIGDTVTANGVTLDTWTFLRDVDANVSGWVSDTLLDRNPGGSRGSTQRC
jgi:hypothetical protein